MALTSDNWISPESRLDALPKAGGQGVAALAHFSHNLSRSVPVGAPGSGHYSAPECPSECPGRTG